MLYMCCCFCPSQNLLLSDSFYSFYDLRKEFHDCYPNVAPVKDQTIQSMAECILSLAPSKAGLALCVDTGSSGPTNF